MNLAEFKHLMIADLVQTRPILANLLTERGDETIIDYSKKLFLNRDSASNEIVQVVSDRIATLLGSEVAHAVGEQLRSYATVITSDHHGILSNELLFQGDMLAGLGARSLGVNYIIVLAFGLVPLNNATYPRGIVFQQQRYPLFGDKLKRTLVAATSACSHDALDSLPLPFTKLLFGAKEVIMRQAMFSDQITIINYHIWDKCINFMPKLIYVQVEDIVSELLQKSLSNYDEIAQLLIEPENRDVILQEFDGVQGAWSVNRGTHFFWGVSNDGKGVALRVEGNNLVGDGIKRELSCEAIREGLSSRKILPGMFVTFLVLLTHRLTCLGGFSQVDYLTQMKARLLSVGRKLKIKCLESALPTVSTTGFCTGPFFMFKDQKVVSIDDFITSANPEELFNEACEDMFSIAEATSIGLRSVYDIFMPENLRRPEIESVNIMNLVKEVSSRG